MVAVHALRGYRVDGRTQGASPITRVLNCKDRSSVLKLVRRPHSLAPTLVALPSVSRVPRAPFAKNRVAGLRSRRKVTLPLVRAECSLNARLPQGGIARACEPLVHPDCSL